MFSSHGTSRANASAASRRRTHFCGAIFSVVIFSFSFFFFPRRFLRSCWLKKILEQKVLTVRSVCVCVRVFSPQCILTGNRLRSCSKVKIVARVGSSFIKMWHAWCRCNQKFPQTNCNPNVVNYFHGHMLSEKVCWGILNRYPRRNITVEPVYPIFAF